MTNTGTGIYSLWSREVKRFFRQPSRVIGGFASPVLFWAVIGSGVGNSIQPQGGGDYLQYFYPGTLVMILLFTAIFSTISVIEDRREGFLQSVLVSPLPRSAVVMGKILGGATLAFIQGVFFLLLGLALSPFLRVAPFGGGWAGALLLLFVLALAAFALTGLGFILAWRMESVQGFHAVMNLFLIPMWLLSGALFPPDGAFRWVAAIMRINPLSYVVAAVRGCLAGPAAAAQVPSLFVSVGLTGLFALAAFGAACLSARERRH